MSKSITNLEKIVDGYVSSLSIAIISKKPDEGSLENFVRRQLWDYARGNGVELAHITPEEAYALEAVRRKAVELAPAFMADYNQHIDSQGRLPKFSKSTVFISASGFLLSLAAYLTTAIFTDSVLVKTAAGLGCLYLGIHPVASYIANRLDRQALAVKTRFETEVKREFYLAVPGS